MLLPLKGRPVAAIVDDADGEIVADFVWGLHVCGYVVGYSSKLKTRSNQILLHRLLLAPPKGLVCDHINGNRLDNRRANLRIVTYSQNNAYRRGVKGVHGGPKGWTACLWKDDKYHYFGTFKSYADARAARLAGERRLFGDHCPSAIPPEAYLPGAVPLKR